MKILLTLPFLLLSLFSFPSWSETMDDLVRREGLWYKRFADVPFSGEVTSGTISTFSGKTVQMRLSGRFEKGKRQGVWTEYWDNGQVFSKKTYVDGRVEGISEMRNRDGSVNSIAEYKNGVQHGVWIRWYEDGTVSHVEQYKNNERVGISFFFAGGGLFSETEYRNDYSKSLSIHNGDVISEREYQDGKSHGIEVSRFRSNLKVSETGFWIESKREGWWEFYFENGSLDHQKTGNYRNGVKISD